MPVRDYMSTLHELDLFDSLSAKDLSKCCATSLTVETSLMRVYSQNGRCIFVSSVTVWPLNPVLSDTGKSLRGRIERHLSFSPDEYNIRDYIDLQVPRAGLH
jgi:hypothetical protein